MTQAEGLGLCEIHAQELGAGPCSLAPERQEEHWAGPAEVHVKQVESQDWQVPE